MASTRRKSAAIALAVVGIAGLSLASASTLQVTGGTIQAGTSLNAACDTNGVAAAFESAWAATQYKADKVVISGIEAACSGGTIRVSVLNAAGTQLAEVSGAVPAAAGGATTVTYAPASFAGTISAADVDRVAVVITK
ncbi:hypothetical protein ICW40_13340 [Actinotalea ferrariae]|uniref:hypothetical protein n=1 Tax=Actinotalea ferrariae TaxID=1386098 RepID=UPI001C8BCFE1|nr:hypothetical protein [Actinotalea ferrariae]MBX9245786.1 hypothetical protein [Actinotalea ferrariae]